MAIFSEAILASSHILQYCMIFFQMDVLLNGVLVDELTTIVHVSRLEYNAKKLTAKLKEMIPRQMVQVNISQLLLLLLF